MFNHSGWLDQIQVGTVPRMVTQSHPYRMRTSLANILLARTSSMDCVNSSSFGHELGAIEPPEEMDWTD